MDVTDQSVFEGIGVIEFYWGLEAKIMTILNYANSRTVRIDR